jgi:hypothetical protein
MSDPAVDRDLSKLAPKFRERVEGAVAELNGRGIDVMVNEAGRSDALQRIYFKRGVTRARTVAGSWHGYYLAIDAISRKRGWDVWPWRAKDGTLHGGDPSWWKPVVETFKRWGCDWGGDWDSIFDGPHFQKGGLRSSPSPWSRRKFAEGKIEDVWKAVGAI